MPKETRREFIKKSGVAGTAALASFSIVNSVNGANSDRLRIGVVGCGGRGTGAVRDAITAAPNVELVAMADIHQSQIDNSLRRLKRFKTNDKQPLPGINVTPDRCFVGLDGYKYVIDSGIDYVLLCTPPGFRPEHMEYAVKKGVHIFAEKPCATDPPGIRRILALLPEMKRKNLGVLCRKE